MRAAREGGGGGGDGRVEVRVEGGRAEGMDGLGRGKRGRPLRGKVTVSGESRSRAEPATRSTNTQTLQCVSGSRVPSAASFPHR